MKFEYNYAARPQAPFGLAPRTEVFYYSAGEVVGPGLYECTYCGQTTKVTHPRSLTTCSRCDATEFAAPSRAA
ncbi:MAG: zinc ribbon-containing protein [Chloroflexota bacterium]